MKHLSKILSVLLCLAMVAGVFAMTVSAADETAGIVYNYANLQAGDKIVLAYKDDTVSYAMGSAPLNNNNGKNMSVVKNAAITDGVLTVTADMAVITLEAGSTTGTFKLKVGEKYLQCRNTSNEVYLVTFNEEYKTQYDWKLSIDGIESAAKEGRYLQCNKTNNQERYACYGNTQCNPSVYKIGATPETKPEETITVSTIADALTLEKGTKVSVEGEITHIDGASLYIQDATGAICVRVGSDVNTSEFSIGGKVLVVGKMDAYKGLIQVSATSCEYTAGTATVTPKAITAAGLIPTNVSYLVTITGSFTVTEVFDNNGKYATPNITVKDADNNSFVIYKAPLTKEGETWPIAVNDTVTSVTGALSISDDTYRLLPGKAADIVFTAAPEVTPGPTESTGATESTESTEGTTGATEGTTGATEGTSKPGTYVPTVQNAPVANKAYKFGLYQVALKKQLYFAGAMDGNFLATTEDAAKAVDVIPVAVEGGWHLSFKDADGKTQYIEIYEYQAGRLGVHITDAPTNVFTWDATAKTFFSTVADQTRYLGTYNDFNTISSSDIKYITGDNASKVDVSQYVAHLYLDEAGKTGDAFQPMFALLILVAGIGLAVVAANRKKFSF